MTPRKRGAVCQLCLVGSRAVNEHTGPDSSPPLYFVHVYSWFTVSISLIAFATLCHLLSTSVNQRCRAEEN